MSSEFDVRGLDEYTNRMLRQIENKYPKEAEKFINKVVGRCKAEAIARTPVRQKGKSKKTKKKWKHKVYKKRGNYFGVVSNASNKIHLIENGHVAENGTWVEGAHMLENTITNQQPRIDQEIDRFIDKMLDF
ncbi:HK97 gp10 family phage protein [Terrisporobacter hibernicus]|uniref:HK97 gp10 family phage protein n=1 Tax=Terrisporobacter hibernicus TaxID=2813371 RepID=A0AAX2ZDA7_9FIRM|nr:HK97 gp10 family phage protein [Terrisporobacter hibernicus]UEL47353.1 HK97 gp10 family phage protein [Terrisporobacter hibernicus]